MYLFCIDSNRLAFAALNYPLLSVEGFRNWSGTYSPKCRHLFQINARSLGSFQAVLISRLDSITYWQIQGTQLKWIWWCCATIQPSQTFCNKKSDRKSLVQCCISSPQTNQNKCTINSGCHITSLKTLCNQIWLNVP